MGLPIVRFAPALAVVLALFAVATGVATAQSDAHPPQIPAAADSEEGWSFDDIKDVFEAIQFIMISIGIGVALSWYWNRHLPAKKLPRIEFEVEVNRVGENETAWMLDVVASVKNLGCEPAELTELRFVLESVVAGSSLEKSGVLAHRNALAPLLQGAWTPDRFVLDPGTRTQRDCAVAVPKTVGHVVVTAHLRHAQRTEAYNASRLVRLG